MTERFGVLMAQESMQVLIAGGADEAYVKGIIVAKMKENCISFIQRNTLRKIGVLECLIENTSLILTHRDIGVYDAHSRNLADYIANEYPFFEGGVEFQFGDNTIKITPLLKIRASDMTLLERSIVFEMKIV